MYEHFAVVTQTPEVKEKIENYLLQTMNSYIAQLTKISDNVQNKFPEQMDTIEDKVCKIYESVRDSFIKNKTEMQDESEMDLMDEDRAKLSKQRLKRGAQQFEIRKKLYSAQYKTPLYECFENLDTELEEAKNELDAKVDELKTLNASDDFRKRIGSIDSIKTTIGFNMGFLKETLQQLQPEGFDNPDTSYADMNLPFSMASVTDIQKTYVDSIRAAMTVINSIPVVKSDLFTLYNQENEVWDTMNKKKRELETMSNSNAKRKA